MKKRITALTLALVMVLGLAAVAASGDKNIAVTPMNMTINGQAVTPLKSDGTPAEVFAYDGATYVTLRYLSELLGIKVEWDKNAPNTAKLVMDKTAGAYQAGTYSATVPGMHGPMTVAVTLSADTIEKVEVTSNVETPGLIDWPVSIIPQEIVDNQSLAVDTVTGVTMSSRAILNGVETALKDAGVDVSALRGKELRRFRHDLNNMMAGVYLQAKEGDLTAVQAFIRDVTEDFDRQTGSQIRLLNQLANVHMTEVKGLLLEKLARMQRETIVTDILDGHLAVS